MLGTENLKIMQILNELIQTMTYDLLGSQVI